MISSKENNPEPTSRETNEKTWRNIQEPKESDEIRNEYGPFHRRFTAGSSTITPERQGIARIAKERQKKVKLKRKTQNLRRTNPNVVEKVIQDFGCCNQSESIDSVNFSNYDFSDNSEAARFSSFWRRQSVEKRNEVEKLKFKEIKNSKNVKKISDPMIFLNQAEYKQNLTEIKRTMRNSDKI